MEFIDILTEDGKETGIKKERNLVHVDGDWHKVVQIFVINNQGMLLQHRALTKKSDPGKWCASASGHISTGEKSIEAAIKEFKEELGIKLDKEDFNLVDTFKSPSVRINNGNKIINNHFVDLYIVNSDIDIRSINLQKEEVSQVGYFKKEEFCEMVDKKDDRLTDTPILFKNVIKYLKD